MSDVAVLLNLTGKLNFEVTDPLLSVVNAGKPLLFYDRLSVESFPTDGALCRQHVERLVSSLCNLLEARSLSGLDHNEQIRLIVTIDLAGGAFQPEEEGVRCFPAQKVRQFRDTISHIFGKGNPLLDRLDYSFIFLFNGNDDEQNVFYQTLAYDGYSGITAEDWIGRGTVNLNHERDQIIEDLNSPEDEALLSDKTIETAYKKFENKLNGVLDAIGERMQEAGVKDEFDRLFDEKTKGVTMVGDFCRFDYDATILWCVSQLVGLNADEFRDDCTFFILRYDSNPVAMRRKSETLVASLVQLLATASSSDYKNLFKSGTLNTPARLFVMGSLDNNDIDKSAFALLEKQVRDCWPYIEKSRWKRDQKVKYKHYKGNSQDPQAVDSHRELNDKLAEERKTMFSDFEKKRKVPFFFGKFVGDWSWYRSVVKCAEYIYHFESVNDRPLYDPPKRITDDEMGHEELESTYADLENEMDTIQKEAPVIKKGKDLNEYVRERCKLMDSFGEGIEKLKKELVKLGYFICLLWIGIFSAVGFTICYAYHFFWFNNEDNLWLVAACFGVAALLFVLSAVVGRACVKSKIKAIYSMMDKDYLKMQRNLQDYLDDVNERVRLQNEADIRRRNIDEMQSKLEAFYRHNKQVDLWMSRYQGIVTKLVTSFQLLQITQNEEGVTSNNIDENDFNMENNAPSLPETIRGGFEAMSAQFGHQGIQISNVTSFVTHFRFAEEGQ